MDDQQLIVPDTPGEIIVVDDTITPHHEEEKPGVDPMAQAVETPAVPEEEPTVDPPIVPVAHEVFGRSSVKPFTILLFLASGARSGHAVPRATLEIDPSLRTSGLLAALPGEELKTLIALLTFLSANGDIKPTAYEVGQALNISEGKARERLARLARFRWQSRSLIATLVRETGMDGYTLSHEFVAYREAGPATRNPLQPAYRAAGREAVVAASRAKYARPRAEVERQIARIQGWPLLEETNGQAGTTIDESGGDTAADYLLQRLLRLGVTAEQAQLLLATFPPEEIEMQIAWLPYRGAKNPASYLVAAITGSYEEPGLLRMRREQQQSGAYVSAAESETNPPPLDISAGSI